MDLFTAIEARYSHKEKFLPDLVPIDDLVMIAKAGLAAPTGNNTQNVQLVILPDRAAVQPLCDIVPTDGMKTTPAAIALFTDSVMRGDGHDFDMENYSAAAQNIFLASTALGYSTVWLDYPFFDETNQKRALEALNAPHGLRLHVVFPIGKPDGRGSRRTKLPYEERLFYNTF
jgi:nitroreductase